MARTIPPTAAEWEAHLKQNGTEGGQQCEAVDYQQVHGQHMQMIENLDDTPVSHDMGMEKQITDDWYGMIRTLRKTPKRRAVPQSAVGSESRNSFTCDETRSKAKGALET